MRRATSIIATAAMAATLLGGSSAQAAQLMNGSFEDVLDDWTANPMLVSIPPVFNHRNAQGEVDYTFNPIEGMRMAALMVNQPDDAQDGDPPEPPTTVVQTFTTSGGWFSGWAAFAAQDALPYNDFAFVRLYNADVDIDLFHSDVQTVGAFGYTLWTPFKTWLGAGEYTVEAGVGNRVDPFSPSYLLLDNFAVTASIPEPTTWAMMLLGFFGLGAVIRRRRAVAA